MAVTHGAPHRSRFLSGMSSRRSLAEKLVHTGSALELDPGAYLALADEGHVFVRLDGSGRFVRARLAGVPPGTRYESGDEIAVQAVDGTWQTVPTVSREVRHPDRREIWITNRTTGKLRLLVSITQDPSTQEAATQEAASQDAGGKDLRELRDA